MAVEVRSSEPVPSEPVPGGGGRADDATVLPGPNDKHGYVRAMFDAIAPRYDLLNSLLSARLHHGWRRVAAAQAALRPGDTALDVCTGTGDLALQLAKRVGPTGRVIGGDFSVPMLRLGQQKTGTRRGGSVHNIHYLVADVQALPHPNNALDAAAVAFRIRTRARAPAPRPPPPVRPRPLRSASATWPTFGAALARWRASSGPAAGWSFW